MKICVFGGGNIAHSLAAKLSDSQPVSVILLPEERWSNHLSYEQGGVLRPARYDVFATSDASIAGGMDIVFIALPQFAFRSALDRLNPYLREGQTVVMLPAPARMSEYAEELIKRGVKVVALQRVPYISRILSYGVSVRISDDRLEHKIVVSNANMKNEWTQLIPRWFGGKVSFLSSFMVFAFNNSNPLLHPSRLVVLFRDWRNHTFLTNPPFYAEWTDESSEVYITADAEMRTVMEQCQVINLERDYESVMTHYAVGSARELTEKIRSIPSFKSILSPMVELNVEWVPDFSSRYFTEDVVYGTKTIQQFARKYNVRTPRIDYLISAVADIRGSDK